MSRILGGRGILLFLTLLALHGVPMHAAAEGNSLHFGIQGGLCFGNLSTEPDLIPFDLETVTRGSGGAHVEFGLTGHVFLEGRVTFTQKGAKGTVPGAGLDLRFLIDYVTVPVLLKVKGGGRLRPFLLAGPEIGFKTGAKVRVSLGDQSQEEDVDDDVNSTDFSASFGAGLEIPAGKVDVFLEGVYSLGLKDVSDADDGEVKTRAFVVSAGLRF